MPAAAQSASADKATPSEDLANDGPELGEEDAEPANGFAHFGFAPELLQALVAIGYQEPSPIQKAAIPELLLGRDLVGQAQTGTGKTAAFALPLLTAIDPNQRTPQVLVLAPTRELAIQVAEAFNTFAAKMPHLRVLPVYGGADFRDQIARLKRGVQIVVGTPGRVMDHMRQGTLDLSGLRTLVLDEADEMLRMGFIDDVEWVLSQLPEKRQVVLFSATMPPEIRRISRQYLNDPAEITIRQKGDDASRIRQRYLTVNAPQKLEALSRVLEAETKEGVIIFARTKAITVAVAESLEAKGYDVAVLNGDVAQSQRERTIDRLKSGHVNVLVATDVAARGLDVDRITLVVNYDIPFDSEAYVHRIGRTGRAGRTGDAILFLTPRERRFLGGLERAVGRPIEPMEVPSNATINQHRLDLLRQKLTTALNPAEDSRREELALLAESCSGSARNTKPLPTSSPWRPCGWPWVRPPCWSMATKTGCASKRPWAATTGATIAASAATSGAAIAVTAAANPAVAWASPVAPPPAAASAPRTASRKRTWSASASRWAGATGSSPATSLAPSPMRLAWAAAASAGSKSLMATAPSTCPRACPMRCSTRSNGCA